MGTQLTHASAVYLEEVATAVRRRARLRETTPALSIKIAMRGAPDVRIRCAPIHVLGCYCSASKTILVRLDGPDLNGTVAHELGHHEMRTHRGSAVVGLGRDYVLEEQCANYFMVAVLVREAALHRFTAEGLSKAEAARRLCVRTSFIALRRAQLRWVASGADRDGETYHRACLRADVELDRMVKVARKAAPAVVRVGEDGKAA